MDPMVRNLAAVALLLAGPGAATAAPMALPVLRDLARTPVRGLRVRAFAATRFNASGNVLVGWMDPPGGADVISEYSPDGATVWECRVGPAGGLHAFARGEDGVTWIARSLPGRTRVLAVGRRGDPRGGFDLLPHAGAAPVRVTALHAGAAGSVVASVPGWAFERDRRGRVIRQVLHHALRSAAPLHDGRWLAALSDPFRFSVYDHAARAFRPLPLDALCQVWDAVGGVEVAPGRWRLKGCFCVPEPAPPGQVMPRKTMEFVDVSPDGGFLWSYGGPGALRVEEFGVQRCATFTRDVIGLPAGRLLVLDGSPGPCAALELDAAGGLVRPWLRAPPAGTGDGGTFGERACGLVGAARLEWTRTAGVQ